MIAAKNSGGACSSPTVRTAPTRPAPPLPASIPCRSRAPTRAWSISPIFSRSWTNAPAVFMITNPNTIGLLESAGLGVITTLLHERGSLVYLDDANMNAIVGVTRPGDFGGRHDALQHPQDIHRPSRRRRSRVWPDCRARQSGALSSDAARREGARGDRRMVSPRIQPPENDWPGPQLLWQRPAS